MSKKALKVRKYIPTEHEECVLLKQWLDLMVNNGKVVLYSHIPHETYTKSWNQKLKNKQVGVKKGVPDYVIVTKKLVLFVEMKRTKGGVVGEEQKQWIEAINNASTGINARVCKGFDEAKEFIETAIKKRN